MEQIRATVNNDLRVDSLSLPEGVVGDLVDALELPNKAKQNAKKQMQWKWQELPDTISLWNNDDQELIMPRGFRDQFEYGMREGFNTEVEWSDSRQSERSFKFIPPWTLRPHQEPAVEAVLASESGIYKAPAGSGKTVTVIEMMRRAQMKKNLIIVDKINIADQWAEEIQKFTGVAPGLIGDGRWDDSGWVTIATNQSLWSKRNELDSKDWFDKFGFVCLDECHAQPAVTFYEIMSRFSARYRIGVSATPSKTGDFEFALAVLGPILHETTREELRKYNILVLPTIIQVPTEFDFPYHGTFKVRAGEDCKVEGCKKRGKPHGHRTNYQTLIKELVHDPERLDLISDMIMGDRGHHVVVPSKRLNHLDLIREAIIEKGWPEDKIFSLTGKSTRAERREIQERIPLLDEAVLLSTIADQALNIPILDRLHLVFPTSNEDGLRQIVGRIERFYHKDSDAVVYDYQDSLVGVLKNQQTTRKYDVYKVEGYKIEYRKTDNTNS